MRVHHRFHVGPCAVDARMQMEFKGWLERTTVHHLAFHVNRANVIHCQRAALARTRIDQHVAVVEQDAGVSVVVDDVRLLQHADAIDQLLLQFLTHITTLVIMPLGKISSGVNCLWAMPCWKVYRAICSQVARFSSMPKGKVSPSNMSRILRA